MSSSPELLENLGDLKGWKGNLEDGVGYLQKALKLYEERTTPKGLQPSFASKPKYSATTLRFNEAFELASSALELLRNLNDDIGTAEAIRDAGSALMGQDRMDEALPYVNEALELYRAQNYDVGTVDCRERLADIYRMQRDYDKALYSLEDAVAFLSQSGNKLSEAEVPEASDTCSGT